MLSSLLQELGLRVMRILAHATALPAVQRALLRSYHRVFKTTLLHYHVKAESRKKLITMGLLSLGTPLTWQQITEIRDFLKEHGLVQFLNICKKLQNRKDDTLKWGDEIEYIVVKIDDENKKVSLHVSSAITVRLILMFRFASRCALRKF